ncbi:MAG: ammonia-forming cytochrome c nitrite reductase subunit c552 [Bryobacterales bacterium]|nr:ammonia-forming cytochrome c nitrite reductase subunit c552 [Bryobacterales bacterium]
MTTKQKILAAAVVAALATAGIAALLINIVERTQEARTPYFQTVQLKDDTQDPAEWGKNFPLHYDAYKRTVDIQRTRYGGSEALPKAPSQADPRDVVSQSKIEEDPRLKRMWLGYAFSVDFREERGHGYMLVDQRNTRRVTEFKQPGACLNCHASTYVYMKQLGGGDLTAGFEKMNAQSYAEATKHVEHPVACIDCHEPSSMKLRISRPAFLEGIKVLKASQGVQNYDPNRDASAQEMRSYVCGQCHVEYYFKGDAKRLTFPWHKGLKAENMFAYYEEVGHKDFVHKESGAPVLKAQHPEFEIYSQGIHARSGVSCADCHMPYKREGGMKISDHHVRSPLLNINRACQGCHHFSEQEMKDRVEQIQVRFTESRNLAMDALMDLIGDIQKAQAAGATEKDLQAARAAQRKAQFFIDLVEAENSVGFHAPGEELRILTVALDTIRQGERSLGARRAAP